MNQYDDVKTVETVIGSRSSFDISFEINPLIYFDLLEQINSEIGTMAFDYSLLIKPQIDIVINVDENEVTDSFVPILKFKTNRYTPGSVYEFEGMTHESDEKLTTTETITHPEVRMWRYASYVTTIISCTALVYMAWLAIQDRKKEDTRQSEKMINKFQDMIAKVSEKTKIEDSMTIISIESFEDLTKIAENLMKPILTEYDTTEDEVKIRKYYVIDGNTRYLYISNINNNR